ncbi:hypothetical protein BRADI_2g06256v3 [Brachypodium distachyon]|uniref:Serine-threonine/tyrosine-protein kinase catalytic domain-containing protein n=2 Tax=Brachypodium distachyon TaxID=15368 RepID=A0A2K2D780_BRADI|nr:hypothetical protein BRADI_2g06256v3 [Brachypodium distachyon]
MPILFDWLVHAQSHLSFAQLQVMNQQHYVGHAADVYSFAILLWELMTSKGTRPQLPENAHPRLLTLMQRCWEASPSKRPSFSDAITELEDIQAEAQGTTSGQRSPGEEKPRHGSWTPQLLLFDGLLTLEKVASHLRPGSVGTSWSRISQSCSHFSSRLWSHFFLHRAKQNYLHVGFCKFQFDVWIRMGFRCPSIKMVVDASVDYNVQLH